MAVQSIGSVINSSFIRSFQGLASSGGSALGARASSGPTIGTGLRLGARTFAAAIQSLNSTIGIVNIADDTLKQLTKITDKMIKVVEKSTSISAGTETRRVLQSDFEDLVKDFRAVVEGSEINSVEYLTQDGLKSLFQRIGLDEESSEGVAAIFRNFSKTGDDDALVSEETKGKRPPEIPVLRRSRISQISDSNISATGSGGITPEYSVYSDTIGGGVEQPYHVSIQGVTTSQPAVTQNQTVLAINETEGNAVNDTTGYTVLKSTEDFVGLNPSGYEQVFVVDPDGTVISQVTNVSSISDIIHSSDISADNRSVAVSFSDGFQEYIKIYSLTDIDAPVATSTEIDSESFALGLTSTVKISNNGQYVAWANANGTSLRQVGSFTDNYLVGVPLTSMTDFLFADADTIVYHTISGSTLTSYDYNSSSPNVILTDSTLTTFSVLENDSRLSNNDGITTSNKTATIAYVTSTATTNKLTVASYDLNSETLKTRYRRELGAGTVDKITLAYQNDLNLSKDRVDVGIVGTLDTLFGDADREMYRVTESRFASNNALFAQASTDPTNVLDGNVLTRADSYRLLGDLKALKQQMSDNVDALAGAREYVANNVELVRAAGFAFLEISNQITGSEDAAQVAQLVAAQIRQNASQAQLAQVENLKNIASQTVELLG